MDFKATSAIYLQIGDYILEKILLRELKPSDKIPSVRELAVLLQVNPNTVVRAFGYLEDNAIIQKQRGIGYFVSDDAYDKALKIKTEHFLHQELPALFRTLDLLGLTLNDLKKIKK